MGRKFPLYVGRIGLRCVIGRRGERNKDEFKQGGRYYKANREAIQVFSSVMLQASVFLKPRTRNGNFLSLEGLDEYLNAYSNH